MEDFSAVWLNTAATNAYTDITESVDELNTTGVELLSSTDDYLYFGFERRFEMIVFTLATAGTYTSLRWEYSNEMDEPSSWKKTIPSDDDLFSSINCHVGFKKLDAWQPVVFTTSSPHECTPPDELGRYWMRVSASAITLAAVASQIECVPYARYTTPEEVASMLQISEFTAATQPTYNRVEDIINQCESRLDYLTKKSWKYRVKSDEEHEFNLNGIKLMRKPIRSVVYVKIWNGSAYETKREARNGDFFSVDELGMLYFARYFMLPARMAMVGPHWWGWGLGEFTFPIKIKYIWGNDIDTDDNGGFISQLAAKMAAIELYRTHDYSIIAVSGLDKIPLDRKVDQWTLEVDEGIESLKSWEVF